MSEALTAEGVMSMAADYDAGVDIDNRSTPEPQTETQTTDTESQVETQASKESATEDATPEASSLKEAEPQKKEAKPEPQQQKKESKFAKEEARKAKTWSEINAEKEAIKAQKEALAREREEWQKTRQTTEASAVNEFRDDKGFSAKDYEQAAKEFDADGDRELAQAARAKAEAVRKNANEHQVKVQQQQFQKSWEDAYERISEKEPWLKDQGSDLYKKTIGLLNQYKVLTTIPDGLAHAVELVKLNETAGRAQAIEAENKSLKEQLDKLTKKTALGKGLPAGQLKAEENDFAKMSLSEQRQRLMKAAQQFDRESA